MPVKPHGQQSPTLTTLPPFDFPQLENCEQVEVATTPLWRDQSLGFVAKVNGDNSADIVYITANGGIALLRACYHADDPRCTIQTSRWDPSKRAHPTGVFRKANGQLRIQEMEKRIQTLEAQLLELQKPSSEYVEPKEDTIGATGAPKQARSAEDLVKVVGTEF
jgi:hypothetical protein